MKTKKLLKTFLIAFIMIPCFVMLSACGGGDKKGDIPNGSYYLTYIGLNDETPLPISDPEVMEKLMTLLEIDLEVEGDLYEMMLNGIVTTMSYMSLDVKGNKMSVSIQQEGIYVMIVELMAQLQGKTAEELLDGKTATEYVEALCIIMGVSLEEFMEEFELDETQEVITYRVENGVIVVEKSTAGDGEEFVSKDSQFLFQDNKIIITGPVDETGESDDTITFIFEKKII